MGTEGDDACGWRVVVVAIGVLHNHPVSRLLGAKAPKKCAKCRLVDFV